MCHGTPACGDGIVQAACGETCDHGASNGGDQCCDGSCLLVDGDADTICDRDEPCTVGGTVAKPKIALVLLGAPVGDERLTFAQEVTLASPLLNPLVDGGRFVLQGAHGVVIDQMIPGGAFGGTSGWHVNARGTSFVYMNKSVNPPGGIIKVLIQDRSANRPGVIGVKVFGRGSYVVGSGDLPLAATFGFGGTGSQVDRCGIATFPGPPTRRSCSVSTKGTSIACR